MKYLRRYPRASRPELRQWHETTREEALKYLRASYASRAAEFLDAENSLQTPFAIYRKCSDELAIKLIEATQQEATQ